MCIRDSTLAAPQNGVALGTAAATGVILNDDFDPTGQLSIGPVHAARGEGQTSSTAAIIARLDAPSGPPLNKSMAAPPTNAHKMPERPP